MAPVRRHSDAATMSTHHRYRHFTYRQARYRVRCREFEAVTAEIVRLRDELDAYIRANPTFQGAVVPLPCPDGAPEIVRAMVAAGACTGVGPMASVAGAIAQRAALAGLAAGADECIIDNGGDVFAVLTHPVVIGLYAGGDTVANRLSFRVSPRETPLALCSSSGRMGHSFSMGACDLATVVARDAALADAAATAAANRVRSVEDVAEALEWCASLGGVDGALISQAEQIGVVGRLPALCRRGGTEQQRP